MTKIDIISGFLGAGKTTLIKKIIETAYKGEKIVLIENEYGEIGIDGGFLQDSGVQINEMNSGCICCSLVGDFSKALIKVLEEFHPERIVIEPSGVAKLSDIIAAVQRTNAPDTVLNSFTAVADVNLCKMYIKNFGEFYIDQISHASCIMLSHTKKASIEKINQCIELLREHNATAPIVTTDWDALTGADLLNAMEQKDTLARTLASMLEEMDEDEDEDECCHHHHHDEDGEEHECCHHHHHDEDGEEHECCHHHHHDEDEECSCGCHHHHHHHDADEVFQSFGRETSTKFTKEDIEHACREFDENPAQYGRILRAKGILPCVDGTWIHFDYVPGSCDVRTGSSSIIGRLCVIGSELQEEHIEELFHI